MGGDSGKFLRKNKGKSEEKIESVRKVCYNEDGLKVQFYNNI